MWLKPWHRVCLHKVEYLRKRNAEEKLALPDAWHRVVKTFGMCF